MSSESTAIRRLTVHDLTRLASGTETAIVLEADLNALEAEVAAARGAVEALLDYYEPCKVDVPRDHCMTHHNKHCQGDAVYAEALALIDWKEG